MAWGLPDRRRRGFKERTLRSDARWRIERTGSRAAGDRFDEQRGNWLRAPPGSALRSIAGLKPCATLQGAQPFPTTRVAQPFRAAIRSTAALCEKLGVGETIGVGLRRFVPRDALLGRWWKRQVHAKNFRGAHGRARDEPHHSCSRVARPVYRSWIDPRPADGIHQGFDQIDFLACGLAAAHSKPVEVGEPPVTSDDRG